MLLLMHDCLRILKLLSKSNPMEAVYLGIDNLYLINGQVRLCDPFLNRTRLLQELIKLKVENESKAQYEAQKDTDDINKMVELTKRRPLTEATRKLVQPEK